MQNRESGILVQGISKAYGKKQILQEISLQAARGEQIAIIGRNGCGKTTLLEILAGVLRPDQGKMIYFGQDMRRQKNAFSARCGYLPQDNPLLEELSVQDNLSLWRGKGGLPDAELMEQLELAELLKTPVHKLSGGMKRRVAIACAAVLHPPLLLLDEPTTSLDSFYRESIHTYMKKYREAGGIVLVATHDEQEMQQSSSCLRMTAGRLEKA